MVSNEDKLLGKPQGTEACRQRDLRSFIYDAVIECPFREKRAMDVLGRQ